MFRLISFKLQHDNTPEDASSDRNETSGTSPFMALITPENLAPCYKYTLYKSHSNLVQSSCI